MDKSVIDAIGASWTGRKSLARKHGDFLCFAMPAVIGSVDSRSLRNLFGFEYFDLWLLVAHFNSAVFY